MRAILYAFASLPLMAVIGISCKEKKGSNLQHFPEAKIAIACPCNYKRDTVAENERETEATRSYTYYNCMDSVSGDTYRLQILFGSDEIYSPNQIFAAIDSVLNAKIIPHERKKFLGYEAMMIKYRRGYELEILTNEFSYFVILEAQDSLDQKFDRYVNSIVLE